MFVMMAHAFVPYWRFYLNNNKEQKHHYNQLNLKRVIKINDYYYKFHHYYSILIINDEYSMCNINTYILYY